jgi:chorismate dehydratase
MGKLRVSAISFLNTAPLMWDFDQGEPPAADGATRSTAHFDITYTIPSNCAEALRAGTADIGIMPIAAYVSIPGLVIIPDVSIAAKNPVRSILLLSKVPLEKVRTVAADTSSRTSVALTQVLFAKWWGGQREFIPMAPDAPKMLAQCDAALLIGDAALTAQRGSYLAYDLAEEWQRHTGKPFVFAFWAVRLAALNELENDLDVAKAFQQSRDHGLQPENLRVIARAWGRRLGMPEAEIIRYLTRNIDYSLDEANRQGMELFFRYAAECGALARQPELRYLGTAGSSLATLEAGA